MSQKRAFQILNFVIVIDFLSYLVLGVVSLRTQTHQYFYYLSFFCVAGLFLMIFHGSQNLGWKNMILIFLIGTLTSQFFESMGCNFGLFFSKYTYPDGSFPGPLVFGFPLYAAIAYGFAAYEIWALTQAIVGQFDNRFRKGDVVLMPIVSSFLFVALDFTTDPLLVTVTHMYWWEEPGIYYGIPYQNYLGWFLFAYVMYQIIALILYKQKNLEPCAAAKKKQFWYYPVLIYGMLFIQHIFYLFIQTDATTVAVQSGEVFEVAQIYKGVSLVAIDTIFAFSVLAFLRVFRSTELSDEKTL